MDRKCLLEEKHVDPTGKRKTHKQNKIYNKGGVYPRCCEERFEVLHLLQTSIIVSRVPSRGRTLFGVLLLWALGQLPDLALYDCMPLTCPVLCVFCINENEKVYRTRDENYQKAGKKKKLMKRRKKQKIERKKRGTMSSLGVPLTREDHTVSQ